MGEKKEKKEHKEDKEHKDKEKKEKKEKKVDNEKERRAEVRSSPDAVDPDLDQRKLFKDGQRFLTPPVADATRGFYESLYSENPDSKIAIRFCVEYGLFDQEKHKKLLKRYNLYKEKGHYDARILINKQ